MKPTTKTFFIELLALSALVICQPLLSTLENSSEFFLVRKNIFLDISVMCLFILVVIPSVLSFFYYILSKLSPIISNIFRILCHTVLLTSFLLIVCKRQELGTNTSFFISGLIGFVLAIALVKVKFLQTFTKVIAPLACIAVPVQFLLSPDIKLILTSTEKDALYAEVKNPVPLVFVILDEFSLSAILNNDLNIDARRFPNFSALAKQSHWFRNATTVSPFTPIAVPAILSGKYPDSVSVPPTIAGYPANLFTLLGKSHAPHITEAVTKLCPNTMCPANISNDDSSHSPSYVTLIADLFAIYLHIITPEEYTDHLPEIDGLLGNFWDTDNSSDAKMPELSRAHRVIEFRKYIEAIEVEERPGLYFIHALLPHLPYQFLESGKSYGAGGGLPGYGHEQWDANSLAIRNAYARYLRQIGAADTLLGELISKLKSLGIYDEAMFVLVADHGMSFQVGTYRRGDFEHSAFYEDIMSVPLFIKLPQQQSGTIHDENVETIDILATVADVMQSSSSWKLDGASVFSSSNFKKIKTLFPGELLRHRRKKLDKTNDNRPSVAQKGKPLVFTPPASHPRATLDWKYELPGFNQSQSDPFYIGPFAAMIGEPLKSFELLSDGGEKYQASVRGLSSTSALEYDKKSETCPCILRGVVTVPLNTKETKIAIAVNGIIRGFADLGIGNKNATRRIFEALISESAYQKGENKLELFLVANVDDGVRPTLKPIKIVLK